MKRFYVVTPLVGYVEPVTDEGFGPWVEEPDVIQIEAETARDAVALGVKVMLEAPWGTYHYCKEQRMDGCSPYTGVVAHEAVE